jgi:glycosyltransferase involved in cell wall biosynthesis
MSGPPTPPGAEPGEGARVTAVVPLKHYEQSFLRAAFDSLARQSCPAWRAVVVIESADVDVFVRLLAAELTDPRIVMVTNEGRKLAGAINTGIRQSSTEFVSLLFGDDMWAPEAVEVLNGYIAREPEVDFFHTARMVIDDAGRRLGVMGSRGSFRLEDFVWGSPVKHLLCFRRTTALAAGGLDESLNSVGPDDYDFPWTMAERGARFRAVPECLYYYRDHREAYRLTTHLPLNVHVREISRILRKHGVSWWTVARVVHRSRRGYLRQCLYRNALDRWFKERVGVDPRRGWRETDPGEP